MPYNMEKEFYINIFSMGIFRYWFFVILGTFAVFYFDTKSVTMAAMYACGICIPIAVLTFFMSYFVAYHKIVLRLKDDILDINFVRKNSYSKEYNIDLSRIISYKEVYTCRRCGYMEFYYSEEECIKIPYSDAVYKELRHEIINILENYNIEKKLTF